MKTLNDVFSRCSPEQIFALGELTGLLYSRKGAQDELESAIINYELAVSKLIESTQGDEHKNIHDFIHFSKLRAGCIDVAATAMVQYNNAYLQFISTPDNQSIVDDWVDAMAVIL